MNKPQVISLFQVRADNAQALYEQAFKYLPDDDPNKKMAKERIEWIRSHKKQ